MKVRFGLALLVVAAMLAAIVWALRPREPVYQGKRLSVWLEELVVQKEGESLDDVSARLPMFTNVVRSLGTDALPQYLKWLSDVPRPPGLADKVDQALGGLSRGRLHLPQRSHQCWKAERSLEVLGSAAAPAIPNLLQLLTDPDAGWVAARCLVFIGPAALPALSNTVMTTSGDARRHAITALADLGPVAQPAAPLLLHLVRSNPPLADYALRALAEVETNATALLPLLIERLADTNTACGAAYGLSCLGRPGLPALLQALTAREAVIRHAAGAGLLPPVQSWTEARNKGDRNLASYSRSFDLYVALIPRFTASDAENPGAPVQALRRYASDPAPAIRDAASNALDSLTPPVRTTPPTAHVRE